LRVSLSRRLAPAPNRSPNPLTAVTTPAFARLVDEDRDDPLDAPDVDDVSSSARLAAPV
jgi:hypothetical protein